MRVYMVQWKIQNSLYVYLQTLLTDITVKTTTLSCKHTDDDRRKAKTANNG